eukprot:CAMPEP_0181223240 /NCGR_PEP_ID=MMETSP1096-20121128/30405_1 /TAXON_ID=156174 ORGANISM="Chrysochromulina ericina, Strain CCMP281" /NCGR_SAMPLE_ID=MMETSP1096 /ASSEMBLY_ACC=CAM_ASM_000453 /LENGTH=34 /DNA_ID= /DNA_START= /DNA_END= /DNA_ORIENTATION=
MKKRTKFLKFQENGPKKYLTKAQREAQREAQQSK